MLLTRVSAAVIVIGSGRALPVELIDTLGDVISVCDGVPGSDAGINSATVPPTWTLLPRTAAAGGALEVKTKMPSDVFGSPSTVPSGSCRKKPLLLRPVTIPLVVTALPANGE